MNILVTGGAGYNGTRVNGYNLSGATHDNLIDNF